MKRMIVKREHVIVCVALLLSSGRYSDNSYALDFHLLPQAARLSVLRERICSYLF